MIEYVIDLFIVIFALTCFGISHTFLASLKVKNYLKNNYPKVLPFYRLFYNLSSLLILYFFFLYLPQPDIIVYDLINPYDFIILGLQLLSLLGLILAFRFFSFKEFIGISQIKRWYQGHYNPDDLDEKMSLKIKGPYRYMRHPVYFFSIMFLVLRPLMDITYLTVVICFVIYFYIGSYYEEKKLVKIFGDDYINYQKNVPRIFPVKFFHPYKAEQK